MDLLYCFEIHAFIWWVTFSEVLEVFPIASDVIFPIAEHLIELLFFQSVIPCLSDCINVRFYGSRNLQIYFF